MFRAAPSVLPVALVRWASAFRVETNHHLTLGHVLHPRGNESIESGGGYQVAVFAEIHWRVTAQLSRTGTGTAPGASAGRFGAHRK